MKKLKLFCVIILSIFLCGCTATYNIDITEDTVVESFEFIETDSSKFDNILYSHTDVTYRSMVLENASWPTGSFYQKGGNPYEPVKMEGVEYYNQELINDGSSLGIKYNYAFKLDDYNDSNAVRSCFKNFSFGNGDTQIRIYANDASNCFYGYKALENIKIVLSTIYPVIEHNATKVENDKYIWDIKAEAAKNTKIEMNLSKDKNYKSENNNLIEDNSSMTFVIIIVIFVLAIGGIVLYLYVKNKNSSKNLVFL